MSPLLSVSDRGPIPFNPLSSFYKQGDVVSVFQLASLSSYFSLLLLELTHPCTHGVKALCIWWKAWRTRRSAIHVGKGATWFSCTSIILGWWQKVSWQATGHWESGTHMDAHSVISCAHSTPPKATEHVSSGITYTICRMAVQEKSMATAHAGLGDLIWKENKFTFLQI